MTSRALETTVFEGSTEEARKTTLARY